MWKHVLIFLPLLSFHGLAQQTAKVAFTLDQIADDFPSAGFESEIGFWTQIFTKHGEKDIVFHDRNDLRIIYKLVIMPTGIRNDPPEARRQSEKLEAEIDELKAQLQSLAKASTGSEELDDDQERLVKLVESLGLAPTQDLFQKLSDNVRYQRGIREKFLEGLLRSGRYLQRIEAIFEGYGMPKVLALMPHVESSFDYSANSKVGAAGIWQFMRGTGRRFLTINRYIDERRDPIRATDAAARYLKENYEALGTWPLAVTAYNHGANGMKRARERHGDDFRRIVDEYESRMFGFASKNFYPEFLAAIQIAKNFPDYFGDVELESPLAFDTIQLDNGYHISHFTQVEGVSENLLKAYNPHLTSYVWGRSKVIPAGFQLRVPPGGKGPVERQLALVKPAASSLTIAEDGSLLYRVRSGNTLGWIARNFGSSVQQIQQLNRLSNPNRIHAGQVLVVSAAPRNGPGRYKVQPGDSLAAIARRFGTTVALLLAANGIDEPDLIFPGQLLIVANNP